MAMCLRGHIWRPAYPKQRCPICAVERSNERTHRSGASRPELNRYAWQQLRAKVKARDHNQCRNCGATEKLSVHHLQRGGPDTYENLVTLCLQCHAYAERAT